MTDRYACQPIAAIWDEAAVYRRWYDVWRICSDVVGHGSSDVIAPPIERVRALEARYGHDVAAACEALRETLHEAGETDAARWLHYGLCSSDVADAGLWLAVRDVTGELVNLTQVAYSVLGRELIAGAHGDAVMYTHGQPARIGCGASRWHRHALNLRLAEASITTAQRRIALPGFAGPTGDSGELTVPQRRAIRARLAGSEQGAGNSAAGQQIGRDPLIAWLQAVSRLATACERFGRDIRLLAMVGEVREGRGPEYRGSSSMPHKNNPTRSERLCGLAPVVRGLVSGYQEAASECWLEHSLEHSSAERVTFPLVTELTGFMLTEVREIAASLEVTDAVHRHNEDLDAAGDSYAERNRLIREGVDGGEAWSEVRYSVPGAGLAYEGPTSAEQAIEDSGFLLG